MRDFAVSWMLLYSLYAVFPPLLVVTVIAIILVYTAINGYIPKT